MMLVVDLEATCWNKHDDLVRRPPHDQREIIEIGAVVLSDDKKEIGAVQMFVRPVRHPTLSKYCMELTHITQKDVDAALPFPEALRKFQEEVERISGIPMKDMTFCSWGQFDRKQVIRECLFHRVPYPFGNHLSLKAEFAHHHGLKRGIGLADAITRSGLKLVGTHHRALDDARNAARVWMWKEVSK